MQTVSTSAQNKTQCIGATVAREKSSKKRMSANALIVTIGAMALLTVLVFLELHIRHLRTPFSNIGQSSEPSYLKFYTGLIPWLS
jgi:hypothetical protein